MTDYKQFKEELVEIAGIIKELPEPLQQKAFDVLIDVFLHGHPQTNSKPMIPSQDKIQEQSSKKNKTRPSTKETLNIVKDLNLGGNSSAQSFKQFVKEKDPKGVLSAMKFNAVAVYYLKKILENEQIGINHIYTCYKEVGKRTPAALQQSIRDTSSREGTIDTKSMENIKITVRGENLVEHDLPLNGEENSEE
jgi:hypothetical protein